MSDICMRFFSIKQFSGVISKTQLSFISEKIEQNESKGVQQVSFYSKSKPYEYKKHEQGHR